MDVKAEVVLLIFTLNCVTLILLSQDLIRYRLCQDRFANYPACIGTGVTTTADPIDIDSTTGTTFTPTTRAAATTTTTKNNTTPTTITTTDITPTTDITTVSITNKIIPVSVTTNATIPTTTDFLITHLTPLLIRSPPPSPSHHHQQQFSPQQFSLQSLPLPSSLPKNERENLPLTPSSPPSSPPTPGSVDMNFSSERYEDGDGKDDLKKDVETCCLIIIATFVSTSIASSQVLGRWIDRWSFRTLTLFPLVGLEAWAVCGLLVCWTPSIPLYLWFVGAALGGSAGGFVTLKASTTLYAVQANPRWDGTVRLAVLQAATTLGVLIAYLSLYIIADDPQSSMNSIFLGITILGIVNVFFVFIFSDKPPMTPVTATTTTPRRDASAGTQIIAHNSRPSLVLYVPREEGEADEDKEEEGEEDVNDGDDDDAKGERENVGKEGKYRKNALTEAGMEKDNICNEEQVKGGEATASSVNQDKKDADVGSGIHSSFPVDNIEIPPKDERQEEIKDKADSTQRAKRKRKLGVIHNFERLTPWNEEEERSQEPVINFAAPSVDHGSLCYPQSPIGVMQNFLHLTPCNEGERSQEPVIKNASPSAYYRSLCYPQSPIPIIISFEDGSSVYGTPPENSSLPASCCGTPPSRALSSYASCTSLETTTEAATGGQQQGLSTHPQEPEAHAGVSPNDLRHENRPYYERLRHQCTGLSSSAPSTLSNLMETKSNGTLHTHLDKPQTVNMQRFSDSQDDLLMTPDVLLTPASSRSSVLSSEGSNSSSSSSSGESRDVMRGEEGNIRYDCASLGDMQGLSPLSVNTNSYFDDSASLRQSGSMMTIQSEGVGEVGEREGRESLAPLTMAGESSGEGVCCAGGGGAGRCLACVVGRLLCRPVSVTFRRRAAGLTGIVVADVVAAFLVSVVAAGVWEVTPLYLEVKLEWSLADWVSFLACQCSLGVVALVVLLPLLRRRLSLQDTTLGVLGGLSSLLSSVCLSFLTSSATSAIPLALLFGPLTMYLNVASAAILMRLVGMTELGGVLLCLGSVQQAGHVTGWLTFYYLYPLLLRHRMPGVAFVTAGLLLLVPSIIFGVLHFSLGLRTRCLTPNRTASPTLASIASQRDPGELQR